MLLSLFPGLLSDYFFQSESMIVPSLALTIGAGSILMLPALWLTLAPYRRHFAAMND